MRDDCIKPGYLKRGIQKNGQGVSIMVKTRKMRNRWISMDAWEDMDSMKRMSGMMED